MSGTDIVGYTYQAENWCPCCAAVAVGWRPDESTTPSANSYIHSTGLERGINVFDEKSFDSGEWPKVIFDSQVETPEERCAGCDKSLIPLP